MYRWQIMNRIADRRIIGIVRAQDAAAAVRAALVTVDAGLDVVEVSLTTPGALEAVAEIVRARPRAVVGAGTVLDETSARLAALAGARFLVAPSLNTGVISTAHRYGLAALPGAATATEIVAALEAGADAVKLFPAVASSPVVVRGLLQALPQAPLVPTGGITAESAPEWIAAGAVACGVGGAITSGDAGTVKDLLDAVQARAGE
ncbi:bifunctional 4-hydroxy-2-oxoglutarate aldolase/2-dehydro-3-deoxy-phosphogluconate aldolase [Nonomuraea typhae]|uniref:Bifunctional 4-hydroxy-2-oxoglutarate aldolase/2-dehydro-3-deoxy-phosphogluconate aldolase n=1 Tax=Nonomuraea typhae TaxID=2603600 RepID=A0ABW7YWH5_9ACTN